MAVFPARRTGRTLTDPSREFEDICERMGQLMNVASGDLAAVPADMPWSPAADLAVRATGPSRIDVTDRPQSNG